MAVSPKWKVYRDDGTYEASCKEPETAAAVVSFLGGGATIRYEHTKQAWKEGPAFDGYAQDSYDLCVERMLGRLNE